MADKELGKQPLTGKPPSPSPPVNFSDKKISTEPCVLEKYDYYDKC
jgi:hypothetical protein